MNLSQALPDFLCYPFLSLTPLAVASLIAGAIATVDDYSKLLHDVGTLMGSYFTTFAVQGR